MSTNCNLPEVENPLLGYYLVNEEFEQGETQTVRRLSNGNNLSKSATYKTQDRTMKPTTNEPWVPAALLFPNLRDKIISDFERSDTESENRTPKRSPVSRDDKIPEELQTDTAREDQEIAECLVLSAAEKIASDKAAAMAESVAQRKAVADLIDCNPDSSWYVLYGDDYQPVVLNNKQYEELRGKLSNDETCVPTKTFISARSKSQLKIIYDEENRFKSVCQLPGPTKEDQSLALGKSLSLTCVPNERHSPPPCHSQPSSGLVDTDLYGQIECLKRRNDQLQVKIDAINGEKCCLRKACRFGGKSETDAGQECNTDVMVAQRKITDLQCELRDLNCEVNRLTEDRFFNEMKCNQHERRIKSLQAELDHCARIEKELRCCVEFAEQQADKERQRSVNCRKSLAKLCHLLQMDCSTTVEELCQQDTADIQCQLEKAAGECLKNCEYYQKAFAQTQCNVKSLEQKLVNSNARCDEECSKVQRLKEQLLTYQEDLQGSVTDLSSRIKSRENELCKTQHRLKELTAKCSHHDSVGKCKDFEIKQLKDHISQLEAERDQCVERLRGVRGSYKTKLVGMKDKYKQRLKCLLDKQVQVCYAKSCDSLEDKNEIAVKKMEAICSEAVSRMQEVQNRLECSSTSETELRKRIDDLNCKLESIRGIHPLCQNVLNEKCTQTNRTSPIPQLLKCPPDHFSPRPVTPRIFSKPLFLPEKPNVSCRLATSVCQPPDIQQEIKRAQQWATNILSQQPCATVARQDPLPCNQRPHQCPDFYQSCSKARQRNCSCIDGCVTALPIADPALQFRPSFLLSCANPTLK